jgi:LmbE family N-acetylglucosaminyl deacetylase
MKALIETIIQKKISCYFISPHLDDAILSCGELMTYLAGKTPLQVATIFTEADTPPYTLSARTFLKQCGGLDAQKLFEKRRQEDRAALESIGAEWRHLGLMDALWRKRAGNQFSRCLGRFVPEFLHLYPTYRFHILSRKMAHEDEKLKKKIFGMIAGMIDNQRQGILFFPLGLGGHVDHIITYLAGLHFSPDVVFYSDFPYCLTNVPNERDMEKQGFQKIIFDEVMEKKHQLIRLYKTQPLFPKEIPIIPEVYYAPKNLLKRFNIMLSSKINENL